MCWVDNAGCGDGGEGGWCGVSVRDVKLVHLCMSVG